MLVSSARFVVMLACYCYRQTERQKQILIIIGPMTSALIRYLQPCFFSSRWIAAFRSRLHHAANRENRWIACVRFSC